MANNTKLLKKITTRELKEKFDFAMTLVNVEKADLDREVTAA